MRGWVDQVVQGFYDTLFAHPPTRAIFREGERPAREKTLRDWYLRTVEEASRLAQRDLPQQEAGPLAEAWRRLGFTVMALISEGYLHAYLETLAQAERWGYFCKGPGTRRPECYETFPQAKAMLSLPRLVLGAPHSGAGKTTVALALLLALKERGLRVQAFKVEPDYLDPTHLEAASGRKVYNPDGFFLDPPCLLSLFQHGAKGADLALVEGVMGLFDGKDPWGKEGSTAQVARLLRAPVVLVVDASAMAGSIAPLVQGFRTFDPAVQVVGVFTNRVGSSRHAELLREALSQVGLPLLGWLPQDPGLEIPECHLGLVLSGEVRPPLEALARAFQVDLEGILRLAAAAPPLPEALPFLPDRS